jgi:hypothetical protein
MTMTEDNEPDLRFLRHIEARLQRGKSPPDPDPIDTEARPWPVLAGNNKRNLIACPICQKPATPTPAASFPRAFFFRDEDSAREYKLSALCQACQDAIFIEPEEGE